MITSRHTFAFLTALVILLPTLSLAASSSTATSTAVSTTSVAVPTATATAPASTSEGTLSVAAQSRIKKLAANMSNNQDAAVRRLDNVATRLDSRLKILEIGGADVTAARMHLADAKLSLAKATSSLDTIDKAVANFIGSATPRESWSSLKLTYTDINTNIRAAYSALVAAIDSASNAPAKTPTTGSTTATTTPTL
jgi:exonuclease VII small subunit